jgi:hypothetical protein
MMKVPSEIGIGTDLEMFLFDNTEKRIVPCVGILDGTKDKPYRPEGYGKGYAIQEDNVMVEFNIPPAHDVANFCHSVSTARKMVMEELHRRYGRKYSLYKRGHVHTFKAADLASAQAQTIGCEPDQNAYEGGAIRTNPPKPGLQRGCGGHVHLGGDFHCPDFVAALFAELFIAVRAGICPTQTDPRTKWYGQPGVYRDKPYGIEYRTPNNRWALDSGSVEMVGHYGLACARYLTENDAVQLQRAFREIPWLKVRKYVMSEKGTTPSQRLYRDIIRAAQKTGVPV